MYKESSQALLMAQNPGMGRIMFYAMWREKRGEALPRQRMKRYLVVFSPLVLVVAEININQSF